MAGVHGAWAFVEDGTFASARWASRTEQMRPRGRACRALVLGRGFLVRGGLGARKEIWVASGVQGACSAYVCARDASPAGRAWWGEARGFCSGARNLATLLSIYLTRRSRNFDAVDLPMHSPLMRCALARQSDSRQDLWPRSGAQRALRTRRAAAGQAQRPEPQASQPEARLKARSGPADGGGGPEWSTARRAAQAHKFAFRF